MKKTVSIIAIIGFVLLAVWLSGCLNFNDRSTASINDITRSPEKYVNSTVTIKGYYAGSEQAFWGPQYIIRDGSGNTVFAELLEGVSSSTLVVNNEYYWTGNVTQDNNGILLKVSNIQTV